MGTDKRERQKANRSERLKQVEAEQKAAERRSRFSLFAIIALFIFGALVLYNVASGSDDETAVDDPSTDPVVTTPEDPDTTIPSTAPLATVVVTAPPPAGEITGDTPCPAEDGSSERITNFAEAPPICIDTDATYTAEVNTTEGTYTLELNAEAAPQTVNNFVVLARYHYYDGVPFHRLDSGFVVQGGDAVGQPIGTGNPGYTIPDEFPTPNDDGMSYELGSLAMANTGQPTSGGSQFFIVTGDRGTALPPQYSLFGSVAEGMDVVMAIDALGTANVGAPTREVLISSIQIIEQ